MWYQRVVPPRDRRRQNILIVGFIGLQLALPLRYYLGDRGEDERFSWRMFSTVRMQRCRVDLEARRTTAGTPDVRPLTPQKDVQVAWVNMLKRNRPAVVRAYLARACEQQDAEEVRYRRSCIDADGRTLPPQELIRRCADGAFREGDGDDGV